VADFEGVSMDSAPTLDAIDEMPQRSYMSVPLAWNSFPPTPSAMGIRPGVRMTPAFGFAASAWWRSGCATGTDGLTIWRHRKWAPPCAHFCVASLGWRMSRRERCRRNRRCPGAQDMRESRCFVPGCGSKPPDN